MESNNKGLIALLCVLGVVIVGLVVGIVIVMNTGNGGSNDEEDNNANADETVMMTSAPTEIDVISTYGEGLLTQKTEESFEAAMQYFDEKSQEAVDGGAYFDVESIRVYLLIENDYLSEAAVFLDKIQEDRLNDAQLYTIYGYYNLVYERLGDEAKANEYQEKKDLIKANSRFEI